MNQKQDINSNEWCECELVSSSKGVTNFIDLVIEIFGPNYLISIRIINLDKVYLFLPIC